MAASFPLFFPLFFFFFIILLPLCPSGGQLLMRPPIRVTPKPPATPSDKSHGPLALPEPADGFEFVGVGPDGQQQPNEERQDTKRGRYRRCTFKYIPSSCNRTEHCDTQRLCVQITGDPCCAQGEGECPPPIQLEVTCLKHKPINWCHHDQDCARSALCCDTGCGYNMCVERHQI